MVADKGVVAFCRCFRSNKFPLCDGSHNQHNEVRDKPLNHRKRSNPRRPPPLDNMSGFNYATVSLVGLFAWPPAPKLLMLMAP